MASFQSDFVNSLIVLLVVILVSLVIFVKPIRENAEKVLTNVRSLKSDASGTFNKMVSVNINNEELLKIYNAKYNPMLDFFVYPPIEPYEIDGNYKSYIEGRLKKVCDFLKNNNLLTVDCFIKSVDDKEVKFYSCDLQSWVEDSCFKYEKTDPFLIYWFETENGPYVGIFYKIR